MTQKKFSKDPKVKIISIKSFLERTNYLSEIHKYLWKEDKRPDCGFYYKITPNFFIEVNYGWTLKNFGVDYSEKLESIQVAIRDGETEYKCFDKKIEELLEEKAKHKYSKKLDKLINDIKRGFKYLKKFKYSGVNNSENKNFNDYIVDVNYKTPKETLKGKYVVFDVETNGVRLSNDDLLSFSIYDPTVGKCYNRYLPLDLQPLVLTGWIHGIKDSDLEKFSHLTQDEVDFIINYFDLKNKTLLSFSGGKGLFDSTFIINYCKRHNLVGFENLNYKNIKSMMPYAGFGTEGQMSKDNLCRLMGIEGVQDVHSSLNDCVLEWKLFEKIENEPLFFIDRHLFKYKNGYVVPVSYLNKYPELKNFANITVPYVVGRGECIFKYSLPENILKDIKKFPTNITGIALENGINARLNVEEHDNFYFFNQNKKHLEYIGSLDGRFTEIKIVTSKDGTLKSLDTRFDDEIEEINEVTKIIMDSVSPVCDYIKNEIFKGEKILSQELSFSDDGKILAKCDLSSPSRVMEIKTYNIINEEGLIRDDLAIQLYYESNGRKTFVLSIIIDEKWDGKSFETKGVYVNIYKVELEISEPKPIYGNITLLDDEIAVLKEIIKNPTILNKQLAIKIKRTSNRIGKIIKALKNLRYIIKEDESKRMSKWLVLRTPEDNKTKYSIFNEEITYYFE